MFKRQINYICRKDILFCIKIPPIQNFDKKFTNTSKDLNFKMLKSFNVIAFNIAINKPKLNTQIDIKLILLRTILLTYIS